MERKLYSRAEKGVIRDVRTPLSQERSDAPVSWESEEPQGNALKVAEASPLNSKMTLSTKFLLGSAGFFVLAAGAAGYFFFGGGNTVSSRNIDLEIVAPSLIDSGKEAQLQVLVTNRNPSTLELVDLVLSYPEGTRDPKDPTKNLTHERQSLGTIEPGRSLKRTATAVFYGEEGSRQVVRATLEYSIAGSNAVFVREQEVEITLGSSPVSVFVEAPPRVTSGAPFELLVTVRSNASEQITDVVVEGQYPFGYSAQSASPRADVGSGLWRLGVLAPGAQKTIRISGSIDGQDGDERVFRFLAGSDADETNTKLSTPFLSVPVSISVERPFITGSIFVDGRSGGSVAVEPGRALRGSIEWRNNLPDAVGNVEAELRFEGPVLKSGSITSTSGFYRSSDSTIVWTSSQDPSLSQVSPGSTGTLDFSFETLSPGVGGTIYTNPTVGLTLTLRGTRAGEVGGGEVSSKTTMDVTLSSVLSLSARSLYSQGVFANSGPTPPRAEGTTSYTVSWTVKNSSNTIGNAAVSAVLPPYVSFVHAQPESGISYDQAIRTVRWDLGDIKAGAGYSLDAREASFQVMLTLSQSQVGQTPTLTGRALLSGIDRFAQVSISASSEAPTTATGDGANGIVLPK